MVLLEIQEVEIVLAFLAFDFISLLNAKVNGVALDLEFQVSVVSLSAFGFEVGDPLFQVSLAVLSL